MEISLEKALSGYYAVSNYRELFRHMGYCIILDMATRQDGGEAHVVLFRDRRCIGFLILHDGYDPTYAPMFCEPGDVDSYRHILEDRIRWWQSLKECCLWFRERGSQFWRAHRVGRDCPELVDAFVIELTHLAVSSD